jgi:GTPase SAR1 family protein
MNYLNKKISQRIHRDNKTWNIEQSSKCSFMIDMKKNEANFYFILPEYYENLFREKITEVWPKITIQNIDKIENFSQESLKYQIFYKLEDPLSLNTDKRCNEPLNSILGVMDIMESTDRVAVFYNFIPTNQSRWSKKCSRTFERAKNNEPLDKDVINKKYAIKIIALTIAKIIDGALEGLTDIFKKEKTEISLLEVAISSLITDKKSLSANTLKKKDSSILRAQIAVLSDSDNKDRKINNANAVAQSFYQLNDDNELAYNELPMKNINYKNYSIGSISNSMSIDECQSFLELPGKTLLDQHKQIDRVDVLETEIPKELQEGTMSIGGVTYKGNTQKSFLSDDKNFKFLTLCLIGPTRSGKTTLISNLTKDSLNNKECTILFDFCGNCELSNDVSAVTNNVLNIDCSNFNTLQGLGYNEITPASNNIFEVYRCAKAKTSQLMTLVNSLNSDDSELKARMERFLEAAALVVFIGNGPIKDVFKVLQDHVSRYEYIKVIPKEQLENMEEYISTLKELDEYSKASKDSVPKVIGTKLSIVSGIINRISKLKQNTYMELMLKKDCKDNINLVEEMQKNQLICIRMPEIMFATEQEKDIYCTYWLTKIWGALQKRKWDIPKMEDRAKVNIVFDELYQVPNCQDFLRSKLSQIAKFSCKPIISCHYLGQISLIRNELKAANSSYMLLQGCDKDNFNELKSELSPYTLEDLLHLKRYTSLNLIKYEGGWTRFITAMPKPIK